MLINIAGIIGAGKSTLLKELESRGYAVSPEPFQQNPFLPLFYQEQERWAYPCQQLFFVLRHQQTALARLKGGVVFIERSIYDDRCFADMLWSKMKPEEQAAYNIWFDYFTSLNNLLPDLTIFLDLSPEQCMENIAKRGREMERGITLEYLRALRNAYMQRFSSLGKVVDNVTGWHQEGIADFVETRINLFRAASGK